MERKAIGTYELAKICHVAAATVGRWVDNGKLPCFTTGGGHRRVWSNDVVTFLKSHNMPVPAQLGEGNALRVLVVDDEAIIRRSIIRIIKKQNPDLEIHEAKDGFEAGHKVASVRPSLIILDVMLPGLNGNDVCVMVRKDERLSSTRILAMSSYKGDEAKNRMLKAGADDFIAKPFEPADLIGKMCGLVPGFQKN